MKHITAFVKPNMLDDVIFALHAIEGFPGARISEVMDIGKGRDRQAHSDREPLHAFPKSMRVEIVCREGMANQIMETIRAKAHTGRPDDGAIFVSPVEQALRICDSECGEEAL